MTGSDALMEARGVSRSFDIRKGPLRRVVRRFNAVEDVSFTLRRGQTLGIVGESGCGKSTLAKMLVTALAPSAGQILLHGPEGPVDLARLDREGLADVRRRIQMVFQDPFSSLNPRMTVAQIVGEPIRINFGTTGAGLRSDVARLLDLVGLDPRLMDRYPHAFSGGQRQRIGLARALALKPEIIVADEPVSALDVSVQAQILNLIERLKAELGVTFLFISHDLGVVQHLCDEVLVMYSGRIVERGPIDTVFGHPGHPYVETLMQAAPTLVPGTLAPQIKGEVADPANRPPGCAFHPRCPHSEAICGKTLPPEIDVEGGASAHGHRAACHFAGRLPLAGVAMEA